MFDLGWMELLIVGVTALVVVGPKELPMMFKKVGFFVGKARKLAREFQYNMEAAADDTGLKEATDILKTVDTYKSPSKVREAAVNKVLKTVDSSNSKKPKKIKVDTKTTSMTNELSAPIKVKKESVVIKNRKSSSSLKSNPGVSKE